MRTHLHLTVLAAILIAVASGPTEAASTDLSPIYASGSWLNGRVDPATLHGKVVLVDIFTFACINCKHVVPNLRALHARESAAQFEIVGVHAPETPYERDRTNLIANLGVQGITWPIRIDNQFAVWNAYGIDAWPTQLIFDRHGMLRKVVVGEGQDDAVNAEIQSLLRER